MKSKSYSTFGEMGPQFKKTSEHEVESTSNWQGYLGVGLMAISMTVIVGVSSFGNMTKNSSYLNLKSKSSHVEVTVSNEYGDVASNTFAYPFLEDSLFAEMWKDNVFKISDPVDGCSYAWEIKGPDSKSGETSTGQFVFTPETTGKYSLEVSETCDDSTSERTPLSTPIWAKYVRRELSTLTDSDREAFLDAFHTLWEVNTVDGQKLYGERYKSLYFFATIHNDGGSNSICDEFHGGSGFVNNHLYLGAYLEQSLQLVNPKVALHYLEYATYFESDAFTIGHYYNQMDGGNWTEILTDKFFGSSDPITGRIVDGRWANSEVPYMSTQFFIDHGVDEDNTFFPREQAKWMKHGNPAHINSPYGLLRAPWNFNPSNYTTRFNNLNQIHSNMDTMDAGVFYYYMGVTCSDYDTFLQNDVVGQPLVSYLKYVEDETHGKIHFTFGGAGGDHAHASDLYLQEKYGFDDIDLVVIGQSAQTFVKLYSTNSDYPDVYECTEDPWQDNTLTTTDWPTEGDGPLCTCGSEYFETQDSLTELIGHFFIEFVNSNTGPQYETIEKVYALSFDEQKDVMVTLCSRMQMDGDMAGSGAATDPLFWVAHGAVERLMQRVVFENVLSDTVYSDPAEFCSGHMTNESEAWLNGYYFVDETIAPQNLTNPELLTALSPTSDEYRDYFNFVYDTSSFSFCSDSDSWFSKDRRR